jgi:hypothetical protein
MKDEALKGAIGAAYQKAPWDGKGISMPPPAAPDLQAELDATNRQVEILSDALAESRRQRQWAGLTDEEKRQIFEREDYQGWLDYINAIEAKLKERNT